MSFIYDEDKDNEPCAYARFISLHSAHDLKLFRKIHRKGWRAGVLSVKHPDDPPPDSLSFGFKNSRICYETAYQAGRQAALLYLRTSGKTHKELL